MAANEGPLGLRRLMQRARWRDGPVRRRRDAADTWPARIPSWYLGPDSDHGLYTALTADPVDEAEFEYMAEAREIMGLDPESGY